MIKKFFIVLLCFLLFGCSNETTSPGQVVDNTLLDDLNEAQEENKIEQIYINAGETKTIQTVYFEEDYEFEITYIGSSIVDEVVPDCYDFEGDIEDEKYIIFEFKVKNLGSKDIENDFVFKNLLGEDSNCKPKFVAGEKYEYYGSFEMLTYIYIASYDYKEYYLGTVSDIAPLATETLYYIVSIPDEATDLTWDCNICAGDKEIFFK